MDSSSLVARSVTALLVALCLLTAFDLWKQFKASRNASELVLYANLLRSSDFLWQVGWRLEAVEERAVVQHQRVSKLHSTATNEWASSFRGVLSSSAEAVQIRGQRLQMHDTWFNDSKLYTISCESNFQLQRVQVGLNKFRSDNRDSCQLFFAATEDVKPNHVFTIHDLEDGAFALRSMSSSNFVQAVPPPPEGAWSMPWKLLVSTPSPGAAERFRISEEGFLYSPLMQGFFQCSGNGDIVKGFPGEYAEKGHFVLKPLDDAQVKEMQTLKALSDHVLGTQRKSIEDFVQRHPPQRDHPHHHGLNSGSEPIKIALTIPMTSRGTDMWDIRDSPFWDNVFPTFIHSIDWNSNTFVFCFYLGFDRGDPLYDTGDAWSDMREVFKQNVQSALSFGASPEVRKRVVENQLRIKLMHFTDLEGAPSQVVNQLALEAVKDGYDYIYQINDDTTIVTPNWASQLVSALQKNPVHPNFGVTGPLDTNNEKIFTHSFVHRTHVEIFQGIFPKAFKNWWSDDWVSTVYGELHTFHLPHVVITHNVGAKKTSGTTRYEVDMNAQLILESELLRGYTRINKWLAERQLPRLPVPRVCNYGPALHFITKHLLEHAIEQRIENPRRQ